MAIGETELRKRRLEGNAYFQVGKLYRAETDFKLHYPEFVDGLDWPISRKLDIDKGDMILCVKYKDPYYFEFLHQGAIVYFQNGTWTMCEKLTRLD